MAPRDKKTNKFCDDDDDLQRKKQSFFKQRFPGFKKKATELSVLCGNSVGFICYGPDNDVHVWPEPQDHNHPQTLTQIVAKFNALSDQKRNHHACDLYDFPNLKGLSGDELRNHLVNLDSHLVGVKQQKISIMKRNLKKTKPKETEEDDHLRVSDNNAIISNRKVASSEDQRLGFGGVFDELGYVLRGSHETFSNIGSSTASKVSRDVGSVTDSSLLDPFTLGFSNDYFPADLMAVTNNLGVCANNGGVWDLSWMDSEFSSTLFTDDWTVSGYNPLLRVTDSFTASTYQTPVTDNLGSVF